MSTRPVSALWSQLISGGAYNEVNQHSNSGLPCHLGCDDSQAHGHPWGGGVSCGPSHWLTTNVRHIVWLSGWSRCLGWLIYNVLTEGPKQGEKFTGHIYQTCQNSALAPAHTSSPVKKSQPEAKWSACRHALYLSSVSLPPSPPYACTCVCSCVLWVHMCVDMHIHVENRKQFWVSFPKMLFTLFFETGNVIGLALPGLARLANGPQESFGFFLSTIGIKVSHHTWLFSHGFWRSKSNLQVCTAKTLVNKLFTQL